MSDGPNLTEKPTVERKANGGRCFFVCVLIAVVYFAHQDGWNWTKAAPMLFGFLPPGLAYHAGYSLWTAVMMAILVKIAWPKHLEDAEDKTRQ